MVTVAPEIKFVPVIVTPRLPPVDPLVGEMLATVGTVGGIKSGVAPGTKAVNPAGGTFKKDVAPQFMVTMAPLLEFFFR